VKAFIESTLDRAAYQPVNPKILAELRQILGPDLVHTAPEVLVCHSYDSQDYSAMPEVVLEPTSAQQVSEIVKLANRYKIPITPFAASTGRTGGSVPIFGGIVLSTRRMNRILKVEVENRLAIIQPHVINDHLNQEVAKYGLYFPPDPSSKGVSTVGGNIAECAGGPHCLKYGVTRDYVQGLEVVLPNGEIVDTGPFGTRNYSGSALIGLVTGCEGTLAVITKAYIKLIPLPKVYRTMLVGFDNLTAMARTLTGVFYSGILPAVMEFIDNAAIRCVEAYMHAGLPVEAESLLLIETDGDAISTEIEFNQILDICKNNGATSIQIAETKERRDQLWLARRSLNAAIMRYKPVKIAEDIAVPRGALLKMLEGTKKIAERYRVHVVNYGHAGDGNIHVNIMLENDPDEIKRGEEAIDEIFRLTLQLNGTCSGEHGIGITKRKYCSWEFQGASYTIQLAMRDTFDSNHIMNPGKIFE
jgi:glycolate oxidase